MRPTFVRRRLQGLHPGAALEQAPAAHEHTPNGITGAGHNVGNGWLRVLRLALEARGSGRNPSSHPLCAVFVEHAADVLTKYRVGGGA